MANLLCRLGFHRWKVWSEVDWELGFAFDYMKCVRPGCKWAGLTWVERERIR